jgi:gamma-glutamyltranspeptidase/glutathione hydrolase
MTFPPTILILALFSVIYSSAVHAASARPAWAAHGMVTSADRDATEVGLSVLKAGGNAMDAAVATALALGVTECYASGLGGGCFILLHTADGKNVTIDGREIAPANSTRLMYVSADSTAELSQTGSLAAGVPGELAALQFALDRYGTKPMAELLEGAIALADTGFIVNSRFQRNLAVSAERLLRFPATRAIFMKSDTVGLQAGDRLLQPDLAATLRRIQEHGVPDFYAGELANRIVTYCAESGGILTAEDLRGYVPMQRLPVTGTYKGFDIISMPPPSSGGIHVIQILNLLEPYDLRSMGAGSSRSLHVIAEAMQIAFADRAEFLGDPAFVTLPATGLVSKEYAASSRARLDSVRHTHLAVAGNPWQFSLAEDTLGAKHTTNLCVVDSKGNAVAITATINTPFGSACVVPGTGILLNNEMDDFVTTPGQPNYYGLIGKESNEIEPGKKPLSSMSPTMLLKDGNVFMVCGSQGGPRIITSVVLAILNVLDYGMSLQAAVDYPRFHQQWIPDKLYLEPEHPQDVVINLSARGHSVDNSVRWSTVTAIMADSVQGGWWGASDNRAEGLAKGF